MDETPIARCEANGVEAYTYPFYVKPPRGMEPAFIFLADHVYNFTTEEKEEIMAHLILIQEEKDLQGLGFQKNEDGVYLLSVPQEP
jgi:hypothetical protein